MLNVYYWSARYKNGQDVFIVGAESKDEAREIIDKDLKKYDFNGGIEEILVFEQIPKIKADEKGILEVY